LLYEFDDGTKKKADIKPFFNSEVFEPLKDINLFHNIKTHGYFVSWLHETVDLSADTLWHIGN
jgi:hypothetical protein